MQVHDVSPELLREDQVAGQIQVSHATLKRWRRSGTGPPAIKVGRLVRYRPEDVQAWLDRHADTPASA